MTKAEMEKILLAKQIASGQYDNTIKSISDVPQDEMPFIQPPPDDEEMDAANAEINDFQNQGLTGGGSDMVQMDGFRVRPASGQLPEQSFQDQGLTEPPKNFGDVVADSSTTGGPALAYKGDEELPESVKRSQRSWLANTLEDLGVNTEKLGEKVKAGFKTEEAPPEAQKSAAAPQVFDTVKGAVAKGEMVPSPDGREGAFVAKKSSGPGKSSDEIAFAKAAKERRDAINQAATVGAAKAAEEFSAGQEYQRRLAESQAREQKVRSDMAAGLKQEEENFRRDIAELRNINTEIDPGRFWGSRGVGSQMMAAAGMILGAFGRGPNQAVEIFQRSIDRDIDAQKASISAKMAKGREQVQQQQNLIGMMRQRFGDDISAELAARTVMNEQFKSQLETLAAKYGGDEQKAKAAEAIALVNQKLAEDTAQLRDRQAQRWMQREALELDKLQTMAKMQGGEAEVRPLPADQAAKAGKLDAAAKSVEGLAEKLEKAVNESKTGFIGEGIARAMSWTEAASNDQEAKMIAETAMKAIKGEAMMEADVERAMKYIPRPGDTLEMIKRKKAAFITLINNEREGLVKGLSAGGFNTKELQKGSVSDSLTKYKK